METELFNLLVSGGPFGAVAAFFFYRWQKAEAELKEERAAFQLRNDAKHEAMIQLQEKRISDTARIEGVISSVNATMSSQSQILQAVLSQKGVT